MHSRDFLHLILILRATRGHRRHLHNFPYLLNIWARVHGNNVDFIHFDNFHNGIPTHEVVPDNNTS